MTTRISGGRRGAIAGIPVAFLAVWAAIYAVASILPAIPLVGGGVFGGQEFILTLAGILFGPIAGAIAATIGGLLASFIGPATAYFGLATFLSPYNRRVGIRTAHAEHAQFTHCYACDFSDRLVGLATLAYVFGDWWIMSTRKQPIGPCISPA